MSEFQVNKNNLKDNRLVSAGDSPADFSLGENDILVNVDRFSFTANNITYGVIGEQLGYWQFFPPTGNDTDGWGIIPVWGFAEVVASNVADIAVGERLFGYFPTADYLQMTPTNIAAPRFVDGAAHRAPLPAGYNTYRRVAAEPGYDSKMDNEIMLLFPLHVTSFCLWDLLNDNDWYGARQIVILSASSKTSIGLASGLNRDLSAPPVVGLTSSRNVDFVEGLGMYESTLAYDDLSSIESDLETVIVDMSGNAQVLGKLHQHLQDNMVYCINVGLTHHQELGKNDGIITERSQFFFAPTHIQERMKQWGPDGFAQKSQDYMKEVADESRDWLKIKTVDGLAGLANIFDQVADGKVAPDEGLIIDV